MKVIIVQTYLPIRLLDDDSDIGRRWVLGIARDSTKAKTAIMKSYSEAPHTIPNTTAIRAHVWVE